MKPWEERFWRKVDRRADACWEWQGRVAWNGYGAFDMTVDGRNSPQRAHRMAYLATFGAIPPGLDVCHHCDNRRCVRPDHLFVGTRKDNMQDAVRKGRVQRYNAAKTHCPRGHTLADALVDRRRGWRRCRECHRLKMVRDNARRRR